MKPLLLFLFLSLSLAGLGQKYSTETMIMSDSLDIIRQPKYDTIAVWLECADTTKPISYNMTIKGYEVRKPKPYNGYLTTTSTGGWTSGYEIVSYLDQFKKPLPFLVWGVKERREK